MKTEERAANYLKGGMTLTAQQRKRLLRKDRKAKKVSAEVADNKVTETE